MSKEKRTIHDYEDILSHSRPVSRRHPKMSGIDRAAQFAPFAALTGHREAVRETARLTDARVEMDENQRALLDEKWNRLRKHREGQVVAVTCFRADESKEGGSYVTIRGVIKKTDTMARCFVMEDGTEILFDDVTDVEISARQCPARCRSRLQ